MVFIKARDIVKSFGYTVQGWWLEIVDFRCLPQGDTEAESAAMARGRSAEFYEAVQQVAQ